MLTGINLGCFRDRAAGVDLAALLGRLAELPGVERVRLSSIEVNHLTDRLLRAMASDGRIAPHLHVPMQSGDDGVLAADAPPLHVRPVPGQAGARPAAGAGRQPDDGRDRRAPERDRRCVRGDASRGAGGRVQQGARLPVLAAPGYQGRGRRPVPPAAKRERSARLRRLSDRQGAAHRRSKLGAVERVLVEPGRGGGYSADYTAFRVENAPEGALVSVLATGLESGAVVGTMCA